MRLLTSISISFAFFLGSLTGQTVHTWTGAGTNDNFNNSANWDGVGVPPTNSPTRIFRFGEEDSGSAQNYEVILNQSRSLGGGSRGQEVGRFEFLPGAETYNFNNTTADPNWLYEIYGVAQGGGAPAGEFTAISNTSGVNQIFNIGIRQEAPGGSSPVEYTVYDSGTGGLTFTKQLQFANNAKDLVLRGEGDINLTNIDNSTGASVSIVVEVDDDTTVTVSDRITEVPRLGLRSGTLLMTGTGFDVIDDANNTASRTNLTMAGGTFALGGNDTQEALFFGSLTLTEDSVIDFGNFGGTIRFRDSSDIAWDPNATLTIANWDGIPELGGGTDRLFFGSNASGLTAQQLSQIQFEGFGSENLHLVDGEVVPVPEPAAVAAGLGLAALIGWRERRRFKSLIASLTDRLCS